MTKLLGTANMYVCERCYNTYYWPRSTSNLKMTYCDVFCENAHLGFTIQALEKRVGAA